MIHSKLTRTNLDINRYYKSRKKERKKYTEQQYESPFDTKWIYYSPVTSCGIALTVRPFGSFNPPIELTASHNVNNRLLPSMSHSTSSSSIMAMSSQTIPTVGVGSGASDVDPSTSTPAATVFRSSALVANSISSSLSVPVSSGIVPVFSVSELEVLFFETENEQKK